MKNRTYNIIWADDKTSVYNTQGEDNELVDILEKYHIRIVDTAKNAKELRQKLEKRISWVDAVITDANYLRQGDVPESERELSGFFETVNILEDLGENGNRIPFILYTGRKLDLLQELCGAGHYLDYFVDNNLYFHKIDNDLSDVFERLIKEVDRVNTPEHQIRCRYPEAFHAASLIEGAEDELMHCLLLDYNKDITIDDVKVRYNAIRQLFENLYAACKQRRILPKMPLNSIPKLLDKGEAEPYKMLINDLMHPALIRSLWFFLDITQDGSHDGLEEGIHVLDYLKETKNSSLLQAVTHIAMDLLVWYEKTTKRVFDGDIWTGKYKYEGYVKETKTYNSSYFTLDDFNIEKKDDLEDCDYIGIKAFGDDNRFPGKKYVKKFQYDIIEKHKNN